MASIASWQLRPGLNPYDRGSNRASHSGSSALRTRAWWHLSMITGIPSGLDFAGFDAFGIYTRLTATGFQDETDQCTRTATSPRALEVKATSPSIPAVTRPALRCVTRRTLTSVLARLRSISFCRFLTLGQSSSLLALKIRCRSRTTSRAGPAQTIESHSSALHPNGRSSGPFTMRRLTCPSVRAVPALGLQRPTCPRQHAFASRTGGYPASYTRRPAEEPATSPRFPVAFRPPAFASGASLLARELRPSYDRPTGRPVLRRLDPDQVSVFHTRETRLGLAVLSTPGTAVSTRPQEHLWPPPAASQRPAPATLCSNPSPGRSLDEASARIHWYSAHTQPSPHL